MRLLSWLRPGIGVKRWILLLALGALIIAAGGVVSFPTLVDLSPLLATLSVDAMLAGGALLAGGTLLTLIAALGLARATLIPYRDVGEGTSLIELLEQRRRQRQGLRVVVLGGGTGLATVLRGLKQQTTSLTAIVSMADDGGSSGVLRDSLGIPPVGDLRNCLIALADAESTAGALLQHRLPAEGGATRGHPIGNLLIAGAIAEEGGSLERGIDRVHRILHVRGRVVPATEVGLQLRGHTREGAVVDGQARLARTRGIARVELLPASPTATQAALEALAHAELIILGPGSLYTSLVPHLLVPGIRRALSERTAPLLWIANVDEQEGETEGMDLRAHLTALEMHGGAGLVDGILATSVNTKSRPTATGTPIAPHLTPRVQGERATDPPIYTRDVVSRLRPHLHDSNLLARAVMSVAPSLRRRLHR